MKALALTPVLLFVINLSAQISTPQKAAPSTTVGKIAPLGSFIAELSYQKNEADEKDTIYTLKFRNAKYSSIITTESVRFSGMGDTVNELYKVFKSVFLEENRNNKDYLVTFTLGTSTVAISNYKVLGTPSAMFLCNGAYFGISEKQVDKLFGK